MTNISYLRAKNQSRILKHKVIRKRFRRASNRLLIALVAGIVTLTTSLVTKAAAPIHGCETTGLHPSVIMNMFRDQARYPNFVLICAHRGYWSEANRPQNSHASFQAAIDAGMDCVENDIRYTSDNVAVIFHDPNINMILADSMKRPIQQVTPIKNVTWSTLQTYWLRDRLFNLTNQKVLSLDQFIDQVKGRTIGNYEFKRENETVAHMTDLIKRLAAKNMLNESLLKGTLSSHDYRNMIHSIPGVEFNDVNYSPKFFYENPEISQEIAAFRTMGIKAYELVIESDDSKYTVLRNLLPDLAAHHERAGQFDMIPESGRGRYRADNTWRKMDPKKDFRGDWDWIFKTNYGFMVTDRPCLNAQYLKRLGKRDITPSF